MASAKGAAVVDFYHSVYQGTERVAGLMVDVVWFQPSDSLRFGCRIGSERQTRLVLKVQTLRVNGTVFDLLAFSEVDLQSAVPLPPVLRNMQTTHGCQVVDVPMHKTSAASHGWVLRRSLPGFHPVHCYDHGPSPAAQKLNGATPQCTYSDGLASVSLFIEPYDIAKDENASDSNAVQRSGGLWSMGAAHALVQRVGLDGWLTAVGEVPVDTLQQFAECLEWLQ